jgi:hypothetical protein
MAQHAANPGYFPDRKFSGPMWGQIFDAKGNFFFQSGNPQLKSPS